MPFGFSDIVPLATSLLGFEGQEETNDHNQALFYQNQAWQEHMRSTAHQTEVKDLLAAGLNPMLSLGGKGSPMGNVTAPVMGNSAAAGMQSAAQAAQIRNMAAQERNIEADTRLKDAQRVGALASAGQAGAHTSSILQDMQLFADRWDLLKEQTHTTRQQGLRHEAEWKFTDRRNQAGFPQAESDEKRQHISLMRDQARKLVNEARLLGLKVPEAVREAAFFESPDGRSAMYFRHAPKNLTSAFMGSLGGVAADVRDAFNQFGKRR